MIIKTPRSLTLPARASAVSRNGSTSERSARDAGRPERLMGNHGADRRPFADRDLRRSRRERAPGGREEAAHVDVELILGPDDGGVDDERDRITCRGPSARTLEERSRAPRGVEIVRRLGRLQEWVLDADDLSGRRQDQVMPGGRPQNDVAACLASGEIDLQARKGSVGQLEVGNAGPNNLPQRQPVEPCGDARERRHQRKADDNRKNPYYFRGARHRFVLSPLQTPRAKKQRGAALSTRPHRAFIGEPQRWIAPPSRASELCQAG